MSPLSRFGPSGNPLNAMSRPRTCKERLPMPSPLAICWFRVTVRSRGAQEHVVRRQVTGHRTPLIVKLADRRRPPVAASAPESPETDACARDGREPKRERAQDQVESVGRGESRRGPRAGPAIDIRPVGSRLAARWSTHSARLRLAGCRRVVRCWCDCGQKRQRATVMAMVALTPSPNARLVAADDVARADDMPRNDAPMPRSTGRMHERKLISVMFRSSFNGLWSIGPTRARGAGRRLPDPSEG